METEVSTRPRTQLDELVPSRYAVKVGDIEVIVISDGVLAPPAESMATNADTKSLNAWLDDRLLAHDTFGWALNAVVVKTPKQTILIDSGLGEEYPDFPRAGHLIQRLKAAGVELGSVTDVVLTHMHFDHVGGLLAHGVKQQLRPDLRVHLSALEAKFWERPDFSKTAMPPALADLARKASLDFLKEYSSYLHLFDQEAEVADGVTVSLTGGHTPGHSVVRVRSGNDRLMFGGDAIFPVSFDHPEWHNGFEHDPEEATRVRIRLFRELAANGELLVATHVSFPSVGRVAVDGDAFRFVPVYWDY